MKYVLSRRTYARQSMPPEHAEGRAQDATLWMDDALQHWPVHTEAAGALAFQPLLACYSASIPALAVTAHERIGLREFVLTFNRPVDGAEGAFQNYISLFPVRQVTSCAWENGNQLRIVLSQDLAQSDNLKIQYSAGNAAWADVPEKSRSSQVWSFTLTSARYWRVFIPSYTWTYNLSSSPTTRDEQAFGTIFFLGKTVPGLKFMVPPGSNAAIEASYQLKLPFKTSNNLLRFTCSLLLSKGEGS